MSAAAAPLHPAMRVEVWSDVVCPWCYVGTRRFEQAVERFRDDGGGDLELVHRAFELDPHVPPEGTDLAEHLARKLGGRERVAAAHRRLAHIGAEVGIEFRWEGKRRVNTFDAHRLGAWALEVAGPEVQAALHQALFRAYFTDGADVADHGVLAGLAAEVGLDRDRAAEALATGAGADAVRADEQRAREAGIHAVPTFVVEGRWTIPGAQDVETFLAVLRRARERLVAAPAPEDDDGCADGACTA